MYAIVVNYRGWRDTIECVESLLASTHRPAQVIVCDNASPDDSVARITAWAAARAGSGLTFERVNRVRAETGEPVAADVALVECGANLGFAGANNVGFRMVLRGERDAYAFMFNNDAVVAPDAIAKMVAAAEADPSAGAVGATIHSHAERDHIEAAGGARINRLTGMSTAVRPNAVSSDAPRMDYIIGCCVLVPRRAIERVGLMDERYFLYAEDADWGLRFADAGFRLLYCADAHVWHKGGGSVVHRSPLHDYYDVRGRLLLVHKHFPASLPVALIYSAGRCLLPKLVRGQWDRLRAATRGYGDFLKYALRST